MGNHEKLSPQEQLLGRQLMRELRTSHLRDLVHDLRGAWAVANPVYHKLTAAGFTNEQLDVLWDLLVRSCDNLCLKYIALMDDMVRSEQASISIAAEDQPGQFVPWQSFVTIESYGFASDLMEAYAVDAASIWEERHTIVPLATEQERREKRGRWARD